ncbi:hypothetical protein [Actinoallomurus sp. NPDC050550]|uniref:hypothetical protein n=1 Tax=Actinoallomurus sp. NPDC050550 TaxID=3154937 RepID=UPI0033D97438
MLHTFRYHGYVTAAPAARPARVPVLVLVAPKVRAMTMAELVASLITDRPEPKTLIPD